MLITSPNNGGAAVVLEMFQPFQTGFGASVEFPLILIYFISITYKIKVLI